MVGGDMSADRLIVRLADPYNAGTPLDVLGRSYLTPTGAFYVRNHGPIPQIDAVRHRLTVDGLVARPRVFSLDELLGSLPRRDLVATLHCAGNRRAELSRIRPTPSPLQWGPDAVGNAHWSGVALADLLALVGPAAEAGYVCFEGADEAATARGRTAFGASIELDCALNGEALLADRMNGESLTPEHGAPLRLVVPGHIGARSVKWLARVSLSRGPSQNWFQAQDYRRGGEALGELELNAAITEPTDGSVVPAGRLTVRGYAVAAPRRRVARVELSTDGDASWRPATLERGADRWAWQLWRATVELPAGAHEIVARAWDDSGQLQPAGAAALWNEGGYMNTAWHRLVVTAL
jgi:sulfite oxidase